MEAASGTASSEPEDRSRGIQIEDLFSYQRIACRPKLYEMILYFPLLAFLLLTRLVVGNLAILVFTLLPQRSFRNLFLQKMFKLLGLVVKVDNYDMHENARILIANHVSIFDKLAVNLVTPCDIVQGLSIEKFNLFSFLKESTSGHSKKELLNDRLATGSFVRLLHFPEAAITNGKVGLLKFNSAIFSHNLTFQPVVISIALSSFMQISPSVLGSHPWSDILWTYLCPSIIYTLKYLPIMIKHPRESAEEFSKRVQATMANAMGLNQTVFTVDDKNELEKRLMVSGSIPSQRRYPAVPSGLSRDNTSTTIGSETNRFGTSRSERSAIFHEKKLSLIEAARKKYLEKQNM